MKTKQYISTTITILLLLLWIPVALDKLFDFASFRAGIMRQPLADGSGQILVYLLPVLEVAVVVLLLFTRSRRMGFGLSSLLMAAFTGYIGIALLGAWEKLPCGCGSVIGGLTWTQHFWFNVFFLGISLAGWAVHDYDTGSRDAIHRASTDTNETLNPGIQDE